MTAAVCNVRVRISAPDPFDGLRGHAYIQARGLAKRIKRAPAATECSCEPCVQARLLPTVQSICAAQERRQPAIPDPLDWNTYSDEALHVLTDYPELASE